VTAGETANEFRAAAHRARQQIRFRVLYANGVSALKWFQVDSDTPNDPKVKAVVREMGAAGVGGLFLLWCHIADHGIRKPGWSLDSFGRPMPETELVIASELNRDDFLKLVTLCTSTGHFVAKAWETKRVIAIPAMAARADTYTKRVVRTRFEPSSNKVGQSSSTRQDSTNKQEPL